VLNSYKNANVAALNKVQINLVQQLNALTIFNKDFGSFEIQVGNNYSFDIT